MIEKEQFNYVQYYMKNIEAIFNNAHAFDELKETFEFIHCNPTAFEKHFFRQMSTELILGFDFNTHTILFNSLSTNSVEIDIFPGKKNKKIYKLFASLIKGEIHFSDVEKEIINLLKAEFEKMYKKMYELQMNSELNMQIFLNYHHLYPLTNQIKLSHQDEKFILNKFTHNSSELFNLSIALEKINYDFNFIFNQMSIEELIEVYRSSNLPQNILMKVKSIVLSQFINIIKDDASKTVYLIDNLITHNSDIINNFLSILDQYHYQPACLFQDRFMTNLGGDIQQKMNHFIYMNADDFNPLNFHFIRSFCSNMTLYVKKEEMAEVKYLIQSGRMMKYIPKDFAIHLIDLDTITNVYSLNESNLILIKK